MAISASTQWELRDSGNALNGAGYDSTIAGAGTDYTLQDAAQLALTDLACLNTTSTLTSVTGGFTAAMIGNAVYISSGTNFTAGFYFITAVASSNSVTLDRTPVSGNGTVGVGRVGGAQTDLRTITSTIGSQVNLGKIWVKAGSYTMNSGSIALPSMASSTAPVTFLNGYNTTRGDNPIGANRPSIDIVANAFTVLANWEVKNIIMTGTATAVFATTGNVAAKVINCKFICTGGAAKAAASSNSNSNIYIGCEFVSVGGYGMSACLGRFLGCYFHDSVYGAQAVGAAANMVGCIFDTCSTAGLLLSGASQNFTNLTIYNCGIGIDFNTQSAIQLSNSIITNCTTGATGTLAVSNNSQYNIWNNTTDVSGLTKGPSDLTVDPLLTDPANGDFTLQKTSPAIGAGAKNGTNTGVVGSYKWNIGVDQDSNEAAWCATAV